MEELKAKLEEFAGTVCEIQKDIELAKSRCKGKKDKGANAKVRVVVVNNTVMLSGCL